MSKNSSTEGLYDFSEDFAYMKDERVRKLAQEMAASNPEVTRLYSPKKKKLKRSEMPLPEMNNQNWKGVFVIFVAISYLFVLFG